MPERWERELARLREVQPPADLDARIAEGPHGELPPPTSRRVVAAVTAFALFAAAGAFAFVVLREDGSNGGVVRGVDDPHLVLDLVSSDLAPSATLRYGDRRVDVVTEGYTWCDGDQCASMTSDFAFYPPVGDYLVVPPGTPIEVTGDGSVRGVRLTDPDDQPIPGGPGLVVPSANGRYVFAFTGVFERGEGSFFFGVQALDDPSSAPDTLTIDCLTGRTNTAIVRPQPNGLHVVVEGIDGFSEFDILTPEGTSSASFSAVGGELQQEGSQGHWPIEPGWWEIGCFATPADLEAGERTAPFQLVDPDDHWASFDLACDEPVLVRFTSDIAGSNGHEEAAAQLVGGLGLEDRVRGAGYDAEDFVVGPTYVVDRNGASVARLQLDALEGSSPPDTLTWGGVFLACQDSGVELTDAAEHGSVPEVPDVLVLRCEGFGPAVDASTVRLQPDGVHIEASNIADAAAVAVDSSSGEIESFVAVEFDSVTEDLVLDVPSGTYWIGCRVPNEQGQIEGGHEEFPDAYVEVTVLPAE